LKKFKIGYLHKIWLVYNGRQLKQIASFLKTFLERNVTKLSAKEVAIQIKSTAKTLGWEIEIRGSVLTITKNIKPNDNADFCRADAEYYSILGLLPMTSAGSIWGTDGGGIGAISAINTGRMVMNMSGGSKRVLSSLAKS
jgi:hypothetical protein